MLVSQKIRASCKFIQKKLKNRKKCTKINKIIQKNSKVFIILKRKLIILEANMDKFKILSPNLKIKACIVKIFRDLVSLI